MQVFIMRHGEAELDAASDPLRALTTSGKEISSQMAQWLNEKVDIERVLVSPYLRAIETWECVQNVLSGSVSMEEFNGLIPGGDPALVCDYLQVLADQGVKSVLLISHLPLVGYLVAELCPEETAPMFATSAIAAVDLETPMGKNAFLWQASPTQVLAKA